MLWYATREQVKDSLEIAHTAHADRLIDTKLEAASRSIEGFLRGAFYPERRTIALDWPTIQYAPSWQLWLPDSIISVEEVVSGGTDITSNVLLRRGDDKQEPPYTYLEVDLSSGSVFASGPTSQRSIQITGVFADAYFPENIGGLLGSTINDSVTSLVINPSTGQYDVGVGSLVRIGTEYMILTNRLLNDSGQNLGGDLDAMQNDVIVSVSDGSLFAQGEVIVIDAERFRINDIAGNNLLVTRAWDGSTLAAHTASADIYAARTFTVLRGVLGTTATSHSASSTVYGQTYGLLNELCTAEAVVLLEQASAGYSRLVGSGASQRESTGQGLEDIRDRAWRTYARKSRLAAI